MKTHKDLDVWKFSVDLITYVYQITADFPQKEVFGITNQIRRASVSIPSNIAEGAGRKSDKEFERFQYIAMGSLQELDTQFIIAHNLSFVSDEAYNEVNNRVETIGKLLNGLINYLKRKNK